MRAKVIVIILKVAQPSTLVKFTIALYQVIKNISSGSENLSIVLLRANCRLNLISLFPGSSRAARS